MDRIESKRRRRPGSGDAPPGQPLPVTVAARITIATCLLGSLLSCALAPNAGDGGWTELFDGKTLAGWKVTDFGGRGAVRVEDGALILKPGNPFTGVTIDDRRMPTIDYEIDVRGARIAGIDFFCALTVPIGDRHCSLVLGGWGGRLVGLSSLDDMDASENQTTRFIDFENGRYYDIRMRVTTERITAWLDAEKIIDQVIRGRSVAVRWEMEPSRPLGLASFETEAAFTRIRYRSLDTSSAGETAAGAGPPADGEDRVSRPDLSGDWDRR